MQEQIKLDITTGSLQTDESTEKFDLIILIQVIGHFYDLEKVILKFINYRKNVGLFFKEGLFNFLNKSFGKYNVYYPPLDLKWYLFKKKRA